MPAQGAASWFVGAHAATKLKIRVMHACGTAAASRRRRGMPAVSSRRRGGMAASRHRGGVEAASRRSRGGVANCERLSLIERRPGGRRVPARDAARPASLETPAPRGEREEDEEEHEEPARLEARGPVAQVGVQQNLRGGQRPVDEAVRQDVRRGRKEVGVSVLVEDVASVDERGNRRHAARRDVAHDGKDEAVPNDETLDETRTVSADGRGVDSRSPLEVHRKIRDTISARPTGYFVAKSS